MDSKEVSALKAFKRHILQHQGVIEQIEAEAVHDLANNEIAWTRFLALLSDVIEYRDALKTFSKEDRKLIGPMFVFGSWKIANYVIDARINAAERSEDA